MIKDEILLREKERYNLPLTISKHEKKLLKKEKNISINFIILLVFNKNHIVLFWNRK